MSYEVGISVLHTGSVWALGYAEEAEALALDIGTVVAIADIDPDSVVHCPSAETS